MADSREQKIIDAVVDRMAGIDGTGDYLSTLATDVNGDPNAADSRPNWDQEQGDLPAISVFQGTVESERWDGEGAIFGRTMPVMIKGFLERGTTASTARKLIADIMRAIRSDDKWTVSGEDMALGTDEKRHTIEYDEQTFEVTGVQVEIEITYLGQKFDMES